MPVPGDAPVRGTAAADPDSLETAGAGGADPAPAAAASSLRTVPLPELLEPPEGAAAAATAFAARLARRRSVREFSAEPIPLEAVRQAVAAAASAPSGANVQPWRFVLVTDADLKRRLREGAEAEERRFYSSSATETWRADLAPLGTDWHKPFLETAPVVIAVFEVHGSETTPQPYYVKESVGIAVGFLLAALHAAGLATLTHTPSPMRWLGEVLERPRHERAFLLIPVGRPAPGARVPAVTRKPLADVLVER